MKYAVTVVVAAGVILGWVAIARAQSLGDVAKKEEARRKGLAKVGKVYTNEALRGTSDRPTKAAAGSGSEAPPPAVEPAPEAPAEQGGPSRDQAYWRERMTKAREGLERSRTFREALQSQINALSADFTARDDPAQRALIGKNRDKVLAELARVNSEITGFEKQLRDIEEEARKANVPPGWLR